MKIHVYHSLRPWRRLFGTNQAKVSAFRYADVDGKGFLTRHQYKVAMTVVFGHCPDRWEVKQVFARTTNPKSLMTFQKFQNCVRKKIDSTRDLIDGESLFIYLDKKLKGYLVMEDLLTAAKESDLRISWVILESVFKEFDRCRNGYIGMAEFLKMLEEKK